MNDTSKKFDTVYKNAPALLGFNKPNDAEQGNIEPADAARFWPKLEQLASEKNIPTLVSPAVSFSSDAWGPIEWLREFLSNCPCCRVDAIAMNSYACDVPSLDQHIRLYYEFNLPIWLTEFASPVLTVIF